MPISISRTNSNAGTVAMTGSLLAGRPSTLIAAPSNVKSMLEDSPLGMVRICTSTTALAPQARASWQILANAAPQPSPCPSVQLEPYEYQQVPETVAIGLTPWLLASSNSAADMVDIQGILPAPASFSRCSTKPGSLLRSSAFSHSAVRASALLCDVS